MDEILKHIPTQNREWVKSLSFENIAEILNIVCMIPSMKDKKFDCKSEIAANIGKHGESEFTDIVNEFLPSDYKLHNVAKTGKCGDFMISWQSSKTNRLYKILVELKNYRNTVPSKEVEKFYRDLQLNQVDGGLLLTLNSKIVGMSKIIEFREFVFDNKKIPVVFTQSKTPELISEVIKLIFHTIEIKDQNENTVANHDNLITHINSLSDNVQMIITCRDTLQLSKHTIEDSLNNVLFSLMTCEYDLVKKIKQMYSTLHEPIHIIEIKDPNKKCDSIDAIKDKINTFGISLELESETFLYEMYMVGWHSDTMDIQKKHWILHKGSPSKDVVIKFKKKNIDVIFPCINNLIYEEIADIPKISVTKSDGIHIQINEKTINHIIKMCKALA